MTDTTRQRTFTAEDYERVCNEGIETFCTCQSIGHNESAKSCPFQLMLQHAADLAREREQQPRLREQALAISELLRTADVGACPLTEGVRILIQRAERAEALLAQVRAWAEQLPRVLDYKHQDLSARLDQQIRAELLTMLNTGEGK